MCQSTLYIYIYKYMRVQRGMLMACMYLILGGRGSSSESKKINPKSIKIVLNSILFSF